MEGVEAGAADAASVANPADVHTAAASSAAVVNVGVAEGEVADTATATSAAMDVADDVSVVVAADGSADIAAVPGFAAADTAGMYTTDVADIAAAANIVNACTATTRYDHTLVKETQPVEGLVTLNQIYVDIPTSITASRRWSDEVKEDGDENDVDSIDQASKVTKEPEAERLDVILKLAAQSSEFIKSMYEARLVQRIREVATSTEHVDDGGPSLVMIKEAMERKQKRMKADEPFPYLITEKTLMEESRPLRYYTQYARMSVVALAGQLDTMIEALLPI
ncbi:hypothetical protein K7X08_029016 [Anisodus acutangulus]|uniref:Uncharacterized protein n=1 Tax=Anisodus acutangulus TaxID=402998 RepID=A0A9Q1L1W5_9SOLA|nr:hypothetical protein K7X08_029016 [Anisodus acutangulus]